MSISDLLSSEQQANKITFKRWRIEELPDSVIIMLIGKRGSGKTTMLMNILYHLRDKFDTGLAVTPTKDTAAEFRKCMCDSLIYDDMKTADAVISIIAELQGVFAEDDTKQLKPRNLYFIADDCMFDKKSFKTTTMRDVFMNGRHYHLNLMSTVQYLMDLDPATRAQIDYVVVVGEPTPDTRDKLWENFFKTVFDNTNEGKRLFYLTLKKLTQDHRAIILDNKTSKNDSITDRIFYFKGKPIHELPPFHLDKPVYRKMHRDTYIPMQVRLDQKKKDILSKSLRKISGMNNQSIIQLEGAKSGSRGRGRGRGKKVTPTRRAPSARPKLPPYRASATRTRVSSRTARTAKTGRSDIKTNVTYRNSDLQSIHSRISGHGHGRSPSPARSDMSMSMLSNTFQIPPPPKRKCRGGVCGMEPEYVNGRRNEKK